MLSIITETPKKLKVNISEQNQLSTRKSKTKMQIEKMKREISEFEELLSKEKDFNNILSNNISNLIDRYNKEWKASEKEWYNWNIGKLVGWFEYILRLNCNNDEKESDEKELNIKNLDFVVIDGKIKDSKYKCKHLSLLDKEDLNDFGILADAHCVIILDEVEKMCDEYPKPSRKRKKSSSSNAISVAKEKDKQNEKEKGKEKEKEGEEQDFDVNIDIDLLESGLLLCFCN